LSPHSAIDDVIASKARWPFVRSWDGVGGLNCGNWQPSFAYGLFIFAILGISVGWIRRWNRQLARLVRYRAADVIIKCAQVSAQKGHADSGDDRDKGNNKSVLGRHRTQVVPPDSFEQKFHTLGFLKPQTILAEIKYRIGKYI